MTSAEINGAMTDKVSRGWDAQGSSNAPIGLPLPMDTNINESESPRSFHNSPPISYSGGEIVHRPLKRSPSNKWNLDSADSRELSLEFILRHDGRRAREDLELKLRRLLKEATGDIDDGAWVEIKDRLEKDELEVEDLRAANQVLLAENQSLVDTKHHLEEKMQTLEGQMQSLQNQNETLSRICGKHETQLTKHELERNQMVMEASSLRRKAFENLPALLTGSPIEADVSEEERQSYYDRTFAGGIKSTVREEVSKVFNKQSMTPKPPKKVSSKKPKKAAYDKHAPGGIPERVMGKFLYYGKF